jgi:hypothetical protein
MTQIFEPPPRVAKARKPGRNAIVLWFWAKPETRSVKIGILATIIVHLLFLLTAPRLFRSEPMARMAPRTGSKLIKIHLVPPPPPVRPRIPVRPPPQQFVEANPNAPENIPDHTNNFSDRNQQAAQEHPVPKSQSDRPTLEGRKDINSNQIVNGRLSKPEPPTPPSPAVAKPQPKTKAVPKREQTPLSGFEKSQGDNPTAFGMNIAKENGDNRPVANQVSGEKDATQDTSPDTTTPKIDPRHPRPRQSLDVYARPAIFRENQFGTSNLGITGMDARWSNYGVYLKRLVETVQVEWDGILDQSGVRPPPGCMVDVTFKLNSKGEVTEIVNVKPSAGTPDSGKDACVTSIAHPAPYGPWTDDMIAMLGTEQTLTFTFFYE